EVVRNVVVFGESGVGKSSLVNLIVGSDAAKTSCDANACTVRTEQYDVIIKEKKFKIWDTAGLDGGSFGFNRTTVAGRDLKRFLHKLLKSNDLSLLVYCVRASRATQALVRHYRTIHSLIFPSGIPMVIVV
ncbi:hypothetical protein HYDPIDRAFT_49525, partial [Hydnomerulius pinastri MD-312]